MKKICVLLMALLLLPALACGEAYTIGEVREQAEELGRWTQTYTDDYGREVAVDVAPIVPEVEAVPILKVTKPEYEVENAYYVCDPSMSTTTEESFGTVLNYFNSTSGDQMKVHFINNIGNTSLFIQYVNQKAKIESDPAKQEEESLSGTLYCSNQIDWTQPYLDGYDLTVQDCVEMANKRLGALFPECNLDLDLVWVEVIPNSRPCYFCTLRPRIRSIPVLMTAFDPVLGIEDHDIPFKEPETWNYLATMRRWDSFLSPSWGYFAYVDGGYQISFAPLSEAGLIEADVPLCSMDKVIKSIEERIEKGYIRNVHALRFGYCCYIGENDENVLYPVWEVECDYYYNPKEKTIDYKELEEVSVTKRLQYRTMIVNAQTGEFMDPIELKDKLLDCPKIITWEDAQS